MVLKRSIAHLLVLSYIGALGIQSGYASQVAIMAAHQLSSRMALETAPSENLYPASSSYAALIQKADQDIGGNSLLAAGHALNEQAVIALADKIKTDVMVNHQVNALSFNQESLSAIGQVTEADNLRTHVAVTTQYDANMPTRVVAKTTGLISFDAGTKKVSAVKTDYYQYNAYGKVDQIQTAKGSYSATASKVNIATQTDSALGYVLSEARLPNNPTQNQNGYDAKSGLPISSTDLKGNRHTISYDAIWTDQPSVETFYASDDSGKVQSSVHYIYNNEGMPLTVTQEDASNKAVSTKTYAYQPVTGLLLSVTTKYANGQSRGMSYQYNNYGVVTHTEYTANGSAVYTVTPQTNAIGLPESVSYTPGAQPTSGSPDQVGGRRISSFGGQQVSSLPLAGEGVGEGEKKMDPPVEPGDDVVGEKFTYDYNPDLTVADMKRNGQLQQATQYDQLDRPIAVENYTNDQSKPARVYQYAYDLNQRKSWVNAQTEAGSLETTYAYTVLGQLRAVSYSSSDQNQLPRNELGLPVSEIEYRYDTDESENSDALNRITSVVEKVDPRAENVILNSIQNPGNKARAVSTSATLTETYQYNSSDPTELDHIAYKSSGLKTEINTTTDYTYDANGSMVTASALRSDGVENTTYTYDAQGRVIHAKITNQGLLQNDIAYQYDVNGGQHQESTTDSSGKTTTMLNYGLEQVVNNDSRYTIMGGSFYNGQYTQDLSDGFSNTGSYNTQTKQTQGNYEYLPFGLQSDVQAKNLMPNILNIDTPLEAYRNQVTDKLTHTQHLGLRDYNPQIRQFQQHDIAAPGAGGINGYAYTSNDPINGFDPTGMSTQKDIGQASKYAGKVNTAEKKSARRRFRINFVITLLMLPLGYFVGPAVGVADDFIASTAGKVAFKAAMTSAFFTSIQMLIAHGRNANVTWKTGVTFLANFVLFFVGDFFAESRGRVRVAAMPEEPLVNDQMPEAGSQREEGQGSDPQLVELQQANATSEEPKVVLKEYVEWRLNVQKSGGNIDFDVKSQNKVLNVVKEYRAAEGSAEKAAVINRGRDLLGDLKERELASRETSNVDRYFKANNIEADEVQLGDGLVYDETGLDSKTSVNRENMGGARGEGAINSPFQ